MFLFLQFLSSIICLMLHPPTRQNKGWQRTFLQYDRSFFLLLLQLSSGSIRCSSVGTTLCLCSGCAQENLGLGLRYDLKHLFDWRCHKISLETPFTSNTIDSLDCLLTYNSFEHDVAHFADMSIRNKASDMSNCERINISCSYFILATGLTQLVQ